MQIAVTTKPGDKYRSIKRPRVYEALRRRGYSKERAARIANAQKALGLFTVFKDARGVDRWLAISSTAYRDRDGEIVSSAALTKAVAIGDATGQRGPLRFWHVPGLDIGDCDYQATAQGGRFLIESGTFRSPVYANALKQRGADHRMSIGFYHPATQPDAAGVFDDIVIFERSIVPAGRESNPFTQIMTKETRMLSSEKLEKLQELLGATPDELNALLAQVQATDKAAQAQGVAYKDADPSPADPPQQETITIGGVIYALTPVVPPAETETTEKAAEDAPEPEPAAPVEAERKDDMLEDPAAVEADMQAFAQTIASAVVEALGPLLTGIETKMEAEKRMAGYVNDMKSLLGQQQAQKDAALAEVKTQVATVQAQVDELNGLQPAATKGYRASQDERTVVKEGDERFKDAHPQPDQFAFADIAANLFNFGAVPPAS